jgi:hypothetical protein
VSFYIEPREFKQVSACLFVAKHPVILPIKVQSTPVSLLTPFPVFFWVYTLGVPALSLKHPFVQIIECFGGYACTVIISLSPNNRIERFYDNINIVTNEF